MAAPTPELVQGLMEKIRQADRFITMGGKGMDRQNDWPSLHRALLLCATESEDPRIKPMIHAMFETDPKFQVNAAPETVGQRIEPSEFAGNAGHVNFYLDSSTGTIQTAGRIITKEDGYIRAIDIFSDPVNPDIIGNGNGLLVPNMGPAEVSRYLRLLTHVQVTGAQILGYAHLPKIPDLPSPKYLEVYNPEKAGKKATDVVVIQPGLESTKASMNQLAQDLAREKFLPFILPHGIQNQPHRYFPTDYFREVGPYLFAKAPARLDDVITRLKELRPDVNVAKLASRIHSTEISGGNYVYNAGKRVFLYSPRFLEGAPGLPSQMRTRWNILSIDTEGVYLDKDAYEQDADFLISLFMGKDGRLHYLAAEAFSKRVPSLANSLAHIIPDEEALLGGCNLADLRHGSIIVAPNKKRAPYAYKILTEIANAKIIEGPAEYPSEGGGLRCSISSFSFV